jgi:hypothetical protein
MAYLKFFDHINGQFLTRSASKISYRDISVEFGKSFDSGFSTRFSDILMAEEELKKMRSTTGMKARYLQTCVLKSCTTTGSGSKMVTDLTPARTTFFAARGYDHGTIAQTS